MRAHLTCNTALELDAGVLIDKVQFLQHFDSLFIIWEQLEILVGNELLQLSNVFVDNILLVPHGKLWFKKSQHEIYTPFPAEDSHGA